MASTGFQGLVAIDYRGSRHVLGRTINAYAIWDRTGVGVPVRLFPLSAEGWSDAWEAFRELEGDAVQPDAWLGGRPDALQPMFAGQIVGRAFRLWGRHFLALVAIGAVVIVPVQGLLFFANAATMRVVTDTTFGTSRLIVDTPLWVDVLGSVLPLLAVALVTAAEVVAVAAILLGRKPSVGAAYRVAIRLALKVLAVVLLGGLLGVIAVVPGVVVVSVGYGLESGALLFTGFALMLLGIVPAIFIAIRLTFGSAAVVVERIGPIQALRRSWGLVRGMGGRVVGVLLLVGLIAAGFGLVVFFIVIAIALAGSGVTAPTADELRTTFLLTQAFTAILQLALGPLQALAIVLLYLDSRVRKEAYSIDDLAREVPVDA